jgi:hypothetical protein
VSARKRLAMLALTLTFWLIWGLIIGLLAMGAGLGKPLPKYGLWGNRLLFLGLALIGALIGGGIGTILFGLSTSTPLAVVVAVVAIILPILGARILSRDTHLR